MAAPAVSKRHDLELVEPFILAIMEMMKVQCGLEVRPGMPYHKHLSSTPPSDVMAVFGVLSRAMGTMVSVALCFTEKDYNAIMERLFHHPPNDQEAHDGINEMVGVVFARVKKLMNLDGQIIKRLIPTIIFGKNLTLSYLTAGQTVIVPLETDAGKFHLELTME
jgi:chemotaxis protein CheX